MKTLLAVVVMLFGVTLVSKSASAIGLNGYSYVEICVENKVFCAVSVIGKNGDWRIEVSPGYEVPPEVSPNGPPVVKANILFYNQMKRRGMETLDTTIDEMKARLSIPAARRKISRAEEACLWSGVGCGAGIVGIMLSGQYYGIPVVAIGCRQARLSCEDYDAQISELQQQILDELELMKEEAAARAGGSGADAKGGGGTGAPGSGVTPGNSTTPDPKLHTGESIIHEGGGGNIPIPKPKVPKDGKPKPKHEE